MGIVSYSKDFIIDFVPEYGDNRTSDRPCIVRLRFISFGEARELQRVMAAKSKGADTQEKSMAIGQAIQKEKFISHIESVSGYFVEEVVDGKTHRKEVTSPEEFYLSAPSEVISEVLSAMEDSYKLTQGQAKNFERVSVGASS